MKTLMRRPVLFLIATFLVVALAAGFTFATNKTSRAHAVSATPTITVSAHTVHPKQKITVAGQGFAPNDTVTVFMDQLENTFGTLACDSQGNCSGSVTIPLTGPQGQHMILAQGSQPGEAVANAPIIINPTVFFDTSQGFPNHGGPGTHTLITGFAFQHNETVSIYWGNATGTLLGTATSDSNEGIFSFLLVAPTHVVPGTYKITVVRSGQKPAMVTTTFTVTPPAVTVPAGVRSKQLLKFHISGFQANENVKFSWNANGGQQIDVLQTDASGSFVSPNLGTVFIPSAPLGSYTLTFTGESSGLHVSAPINLGPGIQTNAFTNAGGTILVSGGGFRSGETLNVSIVGQKKATSVTTAADGSFQASLTAPLSLTPLSRYRVMATNSDGSEKAIGFFYILAPAISWASADINDQNYTAAYGSPGTISGQDFPANEQVTLYWNYQQAGQVEVGTVLAAADGSFSFDLTTPSSPFTGNATIEAIASTSTFTASSQVQTQAAIVLNPTSAMAGQTVQISGGSFAGNATVTIDLEVSATVVVGTATTASNGTFTTSFTIPSDTEGGPATVSASDGTISSSTILVIQVSLTITPTTGSSGTSIAVQSPNFNGDGNDLDCILSQPHISWYDPTTGTSQYLAPASCPQGPLDETVTAPANLVSGRTYEIELIMGSYVIGQATFTAQ